MKFITLQVEPSRCWVDGQKKQHREKCNTFHEISVPVVDSLGFAPIWGVPVTTFQETLTNVLLTNPGMPQLCCVFDTEDYVRIDKMAYYKLLMENKGSIQGKPLPVADPDLPNYLCEYCLDISKIQPVPLIMGEVLHIESLAKNGTHLNHAVNSYITDPIPEVWGETVCSYLKLMPKFDMPESAIRILGQVRYRLQKAWFSYKHLILPLILWGICTDTRPASLPEDKYYLYPGALESCRHSISQLIYFEHEFESWRREDCSLPIYQGIYANVRDRITDSIPLLEKWSHGESIQRNDLCPCGSGLKFKKCHGRYLD